MTRLYADSAFLPRELKSVERLEERGDDRHSSQMLTLAAWIHFRFSEFQFFFGIKSEVVRVSSDHHSQFVRSHSVD